MQPSNRRPNSAKADFDVQVFDEPRLRSEFAMFVWAQTESWRSRWRAEGAAPDADAAFKDDKQTLTDAVVALAGQTISRSELIERLRSVIVGGRSPGLQGMDPKTLVAKITVRARS
jgi:hypothetical protein